MSDTAKLIYREWNKPETAFEIHGWRPQEGLVFVSDIQGNRQVVQLVRASPGGNQAAKQASDFPSELPSEITEMRLVPPPCRTDEFEAQELRAKARGGRKPRSLQPFEPGSRPSDWELARLQYDDEILVVQPEDLTPLAEFLKRFVVERQQEYEARKIELATLQALVDRRIPITGYARYYSDLASLSPMYPCWLGQERQRLELDFTHGCLKWTVAEAWRQPRLRDPILSARWAKAHNLALEAMATQCREFLSTLPPQSPGKDLLTSLGIHRQPGVVRRLLGHPKRYDPVFDLEAPLAAFGDLPWEQLTLCAQVRFLVTFGDGTRRWLIGCPCRAPQNNSERQEFAAQPGPASGQSDNDAVRIEKVVREITSAVPRLEAIPNQLAAAGDHVESKLGSAAQTFRRVEMSLQVLLEDLETNQAYLEQLVEQYKLKENPRQTKRALLNNRVSERVTNFILEHLLKGKAVPKAPTAARMLQKKYATNDGLDRKTVHRHYQIALPILRAAAWPEHLLPASDSVEHAEAGAPGTISKGHATPNPKVSFDDVVKRDSGDTLTPFDLIRKQETGSAEQT